MDELGYQMKTSTAYKLLAAALLGFVAMMLFMPGGAFAQTAAPSDRPWDCLPKQGALKDIGSGVGVVNYDNGWGDSWGWWCLNADQTKWYKNHFKLFHSYRLSVGAVSKVAGVFAAADPLSAANKLLADGSVTPTKANEAAELQNLKDKALAKLNDTKPADPVWQVVPLAGAIDRPMYTVENGAKTENQLGRATNDAICGCDRLILLGKWCPLKQGADTVVTMCRRTK